ncbi:3-oxoadipate enol-lactonase [Xinfangfangia sp. CPCC 101601]|uniref:3-oxoadipate enol-lactonase n=1 Tax=Pseudogemmobacter lacusdianii TaxID=3069608 RepID=A0ABU0VSZ4_9RHOB|nr:3-oxoadipate enol-lactonase [Xinfangfangia sp. CPCC 101601]MDQ2064847.1 3-oxoadipate enol-lactonase [Xinfangfangia sp. CPCC 101601]
MPHVFLPDLRLNVQIEGPETAPALVLIHGLGGDLRLWDGLVKHLPHHRILRMDLRGHGQSDTPEPPYKMGTMIRDVERLIEHFGLKDAVVIGVSLGGMIAQGLAVKRLDLVRGLVLSNTAPRIGTVPQWQERIAAVETSGVGAIAEASFQRWLGRAWRDNPALPALRDTLLATNPKGWIGAASAISGTDFYETTATLRLPTLVIAGANDGSTPPDLMRETADLIPGARYQLMRRVGHLPMLEDPPAYADLLNGFLTAIGHN